MHSHTTSYIHYGFYKASKFLGYETYWLDDIEENKNFNFDDALVISERNVINHLPIVSSAKYFIHNLINDFNEYVPSEHENYWNYFVYHDSYSFPKDLIQIDNHSWISQKTKTIIIRWATDLLPFEINKIKPILHDNNKQCNFFVGSMQGPNIINFANICNNNKKIFINLGGYSGEASQINNGSRFFTQEENIQFVQDSYLSFDIREAISTDINPGYVACRIFKNISYGRWTGSNLPNVSELLDGNVTENRNLEDLYYQLERDSINATADKIQKAMNYVKENHTYINRLKSFLEVIK